MERPEGWFWESEGQAYASLVDRFQNGRMAEVGVAKGLSLSYVLPICRKNNNQIIAIDDWSYAACNYIHFCSFLRDEGYDDLVEIISKTSTEGFKEIEDGSLDLVMIDAGHWFEYVHADILAALPKIKKGGIICGHDYQEQYTDHVIKAVDSVLGKPTDNLVDSFWWYEV